ncbi:hypothetical protein PROFUN_10406 [Planoprotostelium fungivorum]|uniref:EF-hand domain-containing protein n=1 Tax=Planoprotostelium fungivorum TaxID=1890364 RepID=A0A2P6NE15_9EUKA|nr:hypothetical protein PROFUN_10406 [Planoprotostelium fungivorum]
MLHLCKRLAAYPGRAVVQRLHPPPSILPARTTVNTQDLRKALETIRSKPVISSANTRPKKDDDALLLLINRTSTKTPEVRAAAITQFYLSNKESEYSGTTLAAVLESLKIQNNREENLNLFQKMISDPTLRKSLSSSDITNQLLYLSQVGPTRSFWQSVKILNQNGLVVPSDTYISIVENYWNKKEIAKAELFTNLIQHLGVQSEPVMMVMIERYRQIMDFQKAKIYEDLLKARGVQYEAIPKATQTSPPPKKKSSVSVDLRRKQNLISSINSSTRDNDKIIEMFEGVEELQDVASFKCYFTALMDKREYDQILLRYTDLTPQHRRDGRLMYLALRSAVAVDHRDMIQLILRDMQDNRPEFREPNDLDETLSLLIDLEGTLSLVKSFIQNNPGIPPHIHLKLFFKISSELGWKYYEDIVSTDTKVYPGFFDTAIECLQERGERQKINRVIEDFHMKGKTMSIRSWIRLKQLMKDGDAKWCEKAAELILTAEEKERRECYPIVLEEMNKCMDAKSIVRFFSRGRKYMDKDVLKRGYDIIMGALCREDVEGRSLPRIRQILQAAEADTITVSPEEMRRALSLMRQHGKVGEAEALFKQARRRNMLPEDIQTLSDEIIVILVKKAFSHIASGVETQFNMGGNNIKGIYWMETVSHSNNTGLIAFQIYPPENGQSVIPPEKLQKEIAKGTIRPEDPNAQKDLDGDMDERLDRVIKEVWNHYDPKNTGVLPKKILEKFIQDSLDLYAMRKGKKGAKEVVAPGVKFGPAMTETLNKISTGGQATFQQFENFLNCYDIDEALGSFLQISEVAVQHDVNFVDVSHLKSEAAAPKKVVYRDYSNLE